MRNLFRHICSRYWFILGVAFFLVNSVISAGQLAIGNVVPPDLSTGVSLVTGTIVSYPAVAGLKQSFIVDPGRLSVFTDRTIKLERGVMLSCTGKLTPVDEQNSYYRSLGVIAVVYSCVDVKVLGNTNALIQAYANNIRNWLSEFCHAHFPEPTGSLLLGMLIGSDEQFPSEFTSALQQSGTGHIIAVSGFNVNFLAAFLLLFVSLIKRQWLLLISIPVLCFYVAIVGFDNIPAVRALVVNIYLIFAIIAGRRPDPFNALGISMIVLSCCNRFLYLSLSFQLSVSAFFGLILLKPVLKRIIPWQSMITSLSCILGIFPVTVLSFAEVYTWALPINIMIAPLLPLVLEACLVLIPLACLFPEFADKILLPLQGLLELLISGIELVLRLPFATLILNNLGKLTAILVFVLMITAILVLSRKMYVKNNHA
jgi:ComEC/Rec2-related protein